jgi:hypothetical protein
MSHPNSALEDVTFCDAEFDASFMVQFAIMIECCLIKRLSFENHLTPKARTVLANLITSVRGFQHLRGLRLVGCPALTPAGVLASLPSLRYWYWDDS